MDINEWTLAAGSCGLNLGERPVWAKYVNGVALFCFQTSDRWWNCVVRGHCTTGGSTMESAMYSGEKYALDNGVAESDRRTSKKKFAEIVSNQERLSVYYLD